MNYYLWKAIAQENPCRIIDQIICVFMQYFKLGQKTKIVNI
jgi:hypothetical protein